MTLVKIRQLVLGAFAAAMLVAPNSANAFVVLDYTGNSFDTFSAINGPTTPSATYTTANSVNVSITLPAQLAPNLADVIVNPIAFTFTDGINTIDNTNATFSSIFFTTDGTGVITGWYLDVVRNAPVSGGGTVSSIWTDNSISRGLYSDFGNDVLCGPTSTPSSCAFSGDPQYTQAANAFNNPGVWAYRSTGVPEPAGLALFGVGLAGLILARRRKAPA